MDLGGIWRVAAGTEHRRRSFHEPAYDDSSWATMPVPSHWGTGADGDASELAGEESVLYRRRFEGPAGAADKPRATGTQAGEAQTRTTAADGSEQAGAISGAAATGGGGEQTRTTATGGGERAGAISGAAATAGSGEQAGTTAAGGGEQADAAAAGGGRRWWLKLEGLAQQGDIWLDGAYLGHTDGYFVTHELEVTEQMAARREHLLAIDATCPRFGDPDNRTALTGALQDPELCGADDLIVGGVWRPVRLRSSGPVTIRHARAVCAEVRTGGRRGPHPGSAAQEAAGAGAGGSRAMARLALRAVLDVPGGGPVDLRTTVAGTEHIHSHHAADGENRVEWTVDVADPPLWWPHALGDQPLCDLAMEAVAGGAVSDRRDFRIGFRSVAMRRWVLFVNGERLFAKGANLLPTRPLPGAASAAEVADDIRAARAAGLDLVRPVAHIARPELYDAADELGVLVWQDLPIRGLMSRSVAGEARRQAREAIDLLGHRPSVAVWCAHDEPFSRARRRTPTPPVVSRQRPSWNRDVLDRRLCRVLDRCDGSRPVVAHTGVPPRLPLLEGTTSQLWFGLHGGRAADLGPALARVPAMGRFVTAFGTPVTDEQPEVVKTTIEILRRLKYRPAGGFLLHALADPGEPADGAEGADPDTEADNTTPADPDTETSNTATSDPDTETSNTATSDPDTETSNTATSDPDTETSNKTPSDPGEPADGAAGAQERADRVGTGFGVLDAQRKPKPGWQALMDACRPLMAVADPLPATVQGGDRLQLAVHVLNDTRKHEDGMQVRARVIGPDGAVVREQRWQGSAAADDCVRVGRVEALVPDGGPGTLTVELSLTAGASDDEPTVVMNRYTTAIV